MSTVCMCEVMVDRKLLLQTIVDCTELPDHLSGRERCSRQGSRDFAARAGT